MGVGCSSHHLVLYVALAAITHQHLHIMSVCTPPFKAIALLLYARPRPPLLAQVLVECKEVMAPVKHELLTQIAAIAARPVRSDVVNHGAAFMARMEAFNTLREYGDEGKEAMEQVAGAAAAQL